MKAATQIGVRDNTRQAIAESLGHVLADTYILYLKTQNFHWNVTGPNFHALHAMFEEQYQELAGAVDEVAERIRALGRPAPGSYREFAELGSLAEAQGQPDAEAMLRILAEDHETLARHLRDAVTLAEEAGDHATADLLGGRLVTHEKTAWMLRSSLSR
ncbi:MAG: DNA starvation/stationary phase protection protein [Gammaproteobacteria bacterium]|nr:DNA starvation/stationary phase protection protein [Gammaproteobacteria bacterium]NIR83637.1 DNA starvation/stationary phase protection protein [Gammaproteobacteria bacterium]NIR91610.1 DNA starvation/stationary phase protection protein [Gammaproteobacteria bacterium]NIU04799.1 DNA starvation/stationary phase protection protein [Gammaproteobacteria bacterium]NIV53149.1 DNA starvation/stationary phase protection protein [Gammaproteobacteria bacterium]